MAATARSPCMFCQIARGDTSTELLYADDKVVAFLDINPSALRHYLVIPVDHIPTVKDLNRRTEDHQLVNQMLNVGKSLLARDAPESPQYRYVNNLTVNDIFISQSSHSSQGSNSRVMSCRFGFHQPPFNSVDHLHLHCLALPFIPSWRSLKYRSLGPLGGFIEAENLLDKIKPLS